MSAAGSTDALLRRALTEIRQLRARVAELEADRGDAVAIVGIGCRFPGGADTPDTFWERTRAGQDAIGPYPAARRATFGLTPLPPPEAALFGGFLDDIDRFDCGFFELAPREAQSMDPRQRVLLEVCHEALEDALIPASRLAGSRTGLFLGIYNDDFAQLHVRLDRPDGLDGYLGTGTSHSIAAGRLAYQLDLHGPALAIDAACASSLAAVHLAAASLRRGETDVSLAAGVNLILSPMFGMMTDRMGMMAPDSRCKPFDAAADGFVRSEGCGVVVLKRLADALAAGDPIRAVIRGSAMNQDGATNGITAPNGRAQQAVIAAALADAGIAGADVGYVECHGTGTPLGDPVEVDALARVYGTDRDGPCALGSVKGNIGHTEAAAGIAGLIRAVLALERREIPAVAHFRTPNPHLDLGAGLMVPKTVTGWPVGAPHAAVSAFGWSGSNVHVILGPAPVAAPEPVVDALGTPDHLLPLSAASGPALRGLAERVAARLSGGTVDLPGLCRSAWHGREHRRHRLVVRGTSPNEVHRALAAWRDGDGAARGIASGIVPPTAVRTALVFSGQGGQWPGMGRRLLADDADFGAAFAAVSRAAEPFTERSLITELTEADRFDRIDVIQPLIFATQVALADWLRARGVGIDAVVGHSMGEVAAACVAGALSRADAARIIALRSRRLQTVAGQGAMLLVDLPAEAAGDVIRPWRADVDVAVINGPRTTVLSGQPDAIEAIRAELDRRGIFCRPVKVTVASHSPQMDPLLPPLARDLAGIAPGPAASGIRFYSTVEAAPLAGEALVADYWGRNLRQPVRFSDTIRRMASDGHGLFIEVNGHPVLAPSLRDCLGDGGTVVELLRRDDPEAEALVDAVAAVHAAGGRVDATRLYGRPPAVRLPGLTWARDPVGRPVLPVLSGSPADDAAAAFEIHDVAWVPLAEAAGTAVPDGGGRWWLIEGGPAQGDGLAGDLAAALRRAGVTVTLTELTGPDQIDQIIPPADLHDLGGIVYLAGRAPIEDPGSDPVAAQAWQSVALLRLTRQLSLRAGEGPIAPVTLVTRGAEFLPGDAPGAPPSGAGCGQGAMRGFLRVAATEQLPVPLRLVDLPPVAAPEEAGRLAGHLLRFDADDHVALRGGRRLAARLSRRDVARVQPPPSLRMDRSYVVTGGLGGVGLRLAEDLVDWGARHLALIGRRPPGPEAEAVLARLTGRGATISTHAVDVADAVALGRALDAIRQAAPIAGIVHAAAVIDDAVIDNLTPERMIAVFGAKVGGAWTLHRLTQADRLDWFCLFSSVSGLLGMPGQANYAAANTAVDALAQQRLAAGLPAHVVAWGPWAEVGLAAADGRRGERLAARGLASLSPAGCVRALGHLLSGPGGSAAVMRFDRALWGAHYAVAAMRPMFATDPLAVPMAGSPSPAATGPALPAELAALAPGQPRRAKLLQRIAGEIALVLRVDAGRVRPDEPLRALGLDSLMALELRNRLERLTGLSLPATLAWAHPTPDRLAAHLADRLEPTRTAELSPAAAASTVAAEQLPAKTYAAEDLAALSDDEALSLLLVGG